MEKKKYKSAEQYRQLARAGFRRGFHPSEAEAKRLVKQGAIRARYLGADVRVQSGLKSMRVCTNAGAAVRLAPPAGFSMGTSLASMAARRSKIRAAPLLRRRAREVQQQDAAWRADPNSHGLPRPRPF